MSSAQHELNRVVVVGTSGSGKSTTGARLAAKLGAEFIELDQLFWGPNWQPKPEAQFAALTRAAVARDRWVVAGDYSAVRGEIWPRANAVVWLNLSFAVSCCALRRA